MARTGRPKKREGARRLLDEAQTLPKHHPAVAKLLDTLAAVDADEKAVEAALGNAMNALRALNVRPQLQAEILAQKTKLRFSPAHCVARLSQDKKTLARLSAVIQAELAMVKMELAEAEVNFRSWALSQPRVDQYKLDLFTKFEAAGFDARAARKISVSDIEKFMEPFAEREISPDNAQDIKAQPVINQRPKVTLTWRPDNPWISIVDKAEGFEFSSRPISDREELAKWRRCGLPPFSSLEEFGYPELYGGFQRATGAKAQANACWKICERWLRDYVKIDHESNTARKPAWTLLFGLRYGYAPGLGLDTVVLPSPKAPDAVLAAQRT